MSLWVVAHEQPAMSLVLGCLSRPGGDARIACRHAWCAAQDDWVFCPSEGWWPWPIYVTTYGAAVDRIFDRDEVLRMARHFRGRMVMWDDVLRWRE